ncbi:asparagine synthase (glutamine-hydrolyzing) [Bacillus anthracis]|uniref:asparagine synthase (glutamine-hydrolyzing) n=1 Tax=Bacillus sp. N35-10-4 TaxID=1866315 RepID=UPI0008FDE7B5|nr:asparagine synthase (glutamine-hydrolyzing) [Bacillus sp. N35-10-4]OJD55690.1 asparagine synthase (glutamine-hydrolyzing) [Bacillus sp. N35-10-4]PFM20618.1 asparagine synthase (glutamine-hydrolyzing) [Bacillus anthracis]PGH91973.1 asparagine synthase (glutamine-hydrolyzing) [Bacillus anthracis]PGP22913.1 asparagine synthase (glutamine-hydrolyzing) [Bacillus anthracis]
MCGIAGYVGKIISELPVVEEALLNMQHRGPDNEKIVRVGHAVLGAVRLSIRDEREVAHQPFTSSSGRWIVSFNGELNNHLSLRKQLGINIDWKTDSDIETIAMALELNGWNGLSHLKGMFAIAAWDTLSETLYLTRDYPGIKPLYWAKTSDGSFLYASEFSALCNMLRRLNNPLTISYNKAMEYIMYRGTLIEPETLVNSVKKVRPGEIFKVTRNLDIHVLQSSNILPTYKKANLAELDNEFVKSISNTIDPHRKMGMFLSGGVDSSTVLAELVNQGADVEAFTLRYSKTGSYSYSEIPFSRYICNKLSVPLQEVELTEERFLELLPTALSRQDGLSMDPTIVAYHELGAAAARNDLKIVVTGTGSDEVFGSYEWLHAETADQFDEWMRPATMPLFMTINPEYWETIHRDSFNRRKAILKEYEQRGFTDKESIRLFGMFHLEADALPRVDLGTMSSSIECRVPLLDQEFISRALTIPSDTDKKMFRNLAAKRVPQEIMQRPKCGFPHPVFVWLKHGILAEEVYKVLSEGILREHINQTALKNFFEDKSSLLTKRPSALLYNSSSSLWYLFAFSLWCDINQFNIETSL